MVWHGLSLTQISFTLNGYSNSSYLSNLKNLYESSKLGNRQVKNISDLPNNAAGVSQLDWAYLSSAPAYLKLYQNQAFKETLLALKRQLFAKYLPPGSPPYMVVFDL